MRANLAASEEKIKLLQNGNENQSAPPLVARPLNDATSQTAEVSNVSCAKCSEEKEKDGAPGDSVPFLPELQLVRKEWSALFHEKREIQNLLAKQEQKERDLDNKIHTKQMVVDRLTKLCLSNMK